MSLLAVEQDTQQVPTSSVVVHEAIPGTHSYAKSEPCGYWHKPLL